MKKECLKIIIPEEFGEIPIMVIRARGNRKIIFDIGPCECEKYIDTVKNRFALVWKSNEYMKISIDEIRWITAEGSYSLIHMTDGRELIVSFHLSVIEKNLPPSDFLRIHRSYIINLNLVDTLSANLLRIGDVSLPIGREYREKVLDRFIFLGIRRSGKKRESATRARGNQASETDVHRE